jgi:hypothetical protein
MNKFSSQVTESVDDLYSAVTDIITNYQELKQTKFVLDALEDLMKIQ